MKYVCETRPVADHWYPKDISVRSKIDEYMSWHHTNLRIGAGFTFRKQVKDFNLPFQLFDFNPFVPSALFL